MASTHKNFKIKNGLFVTDSANTQNLRVRDTALIQEKLSLDSTDVYGIQYGGVAINTNTQIGGPTQSAFNFTSKDSSFDAVLSVGVKNQFNSTIGVKGTTSANDFVVGFPSTATSFKIKSGVGQSPANLSGGTDLLTIGTGGKVNITNATEASTKTNAALTIVGGLGVDKNIRAQDIIAQGNVTATGTLFGTLSAASLSARSTSDLSEGTNLYYTDARVTHISTLLF